MAIIIVAITLILVAVCCYFAYCIKEIREAEKGFYDILFFTKFFQEILKNGKWNTFIRKDAIVYVTRNILITKSDIDLNALNIKKENLFELKALSNDENSETKKGCLWYEFKTDTETISFAMKISDAHIKLIKAIKNTIIICKIDKNMVKMSLNGTFEEIMYVSSVESIGQSLALVLQNKEMAYREKYNKIFYLFDELYETYNLIEYIKLLLNSHDSVIRKGFRNSRNSV